jgi:hypothetical protein
MVTCSPPDYSELLVTLLMTLLSSGIMGFTSHLSQDLWIVFNQGGENRILWMHEAEAIKESKIVDTTNVA